MKLLILSILCVFSCAFNFEDTDYNNVFLAGQTTDVIVDSTTESTESTTELPTTGSTTESSTTSTTTSTTSTVSTGSTRSTTPQTHSEETKRTTIQPNGKVEVIVTRSMYRLMDEAFRQRLINFESRIATLLDDRERVRSEMESFKPNTDEDFSDEEFFSGLLQELKKDR